MSEHLEVTVRSNIEALNAKVVHEALVSMVDETMAGAEGFLRADRAHHTRTGAMERAIHRDATKDAVGLIESTLGIFPVVPVNDRPTHGRYRHEQAPLFVEEGTRGTIFAARPGALMTNKSEGIFNRRSVRGQPGQHFMFKTYAEAQLLLRSNPSLEVALETMAAEAAAMLPEVER